MKQKLEFIKRNWILYALMVPVVVYFIIFRILPLIGMKLAFEDYRIVGDNVFVGLTHFKTLFSSPVFLNVLKNTVIISTMKILFFFPVPIIISFLVNSLTYQKLRKSIQSIIYLPHFLSWVVIAGIWISLLNPETGGVNQILNFFRLPSMDFMTDKGTIRWVLVFSEMWRSAGWDSIIYLAAILKINPALYESARIEGASKIQQSRFITLPALKTTIITVFILNLGFFMNAGFDQVFNFMNDSVISVIDILDTYVNRIGLQLGQYSIATAASLFKGVIGMILITSTHFISKKISGKGVW